MKYLKTFENNEPKKIVVYYGNGNIYYIKYKLNDKYHRENGPAYQEWYKNGQKYYESYIINGKLHREDGPAYQIWYENGQKMYDMYYINGEYHREDGPAYQLWYENGQKRVETYYLNSIEYKREDWLNKLKKMKSPHYKEQKERYELEQDMEKYNL